MKPAFDWKAKEKWARGLDLDSIACNIRDAQEAIQAYPESENAGYYQDEIHVLVMERNRRQKS